MKLTLYINGNRHATWPLSPPTPSRYHTDREKHEIRKDYIDGELELAKFSWERIIGNRPYDIALEVISEFPALRTQAPIVRLAG